MAPAGTVRGRKLTDPLVALATYLTESRRVNTFSATLQLPGRARVEAEDFFALRNAFGITGYMDSGEALIAIQNTIALKILKVPDAGT